jgi:hypothetical protein|uniref:Uncharacterized protein n=1 Tax=Populus trichocarpa TaxID=3694 RepID=U5GQR3_POPTR
MEGGMKPSRLKVCLLESEKQPQDNQIGYHYFVDLSPFSAFCFVLCSLTSSLIFYSLWSINFVSIQVLEMCSVVYVFSDSPQYCQAC